MPPCLALSPRHQQAAIPRLPVRLGSAQPQEAVPLAVADLGQVPLSFSFPIRNTSLVNKDPAKMPEPGRGSQKQGVGAWAGKGEKSTRDHERGLRRRRERRRGARDARYLGVVCSGNKVRLGGREDEKVRTDEDRGCGRWISRWDFIPRLGEPPKEANRETTDSSFHLQGT